LSDKLKRHRTFAAISIAGGMVWPVVILLFDAFVIDMSATKVGAYIGIPGAGFSIPPLKYFRACERTGEE